LATPCPTRFTPRKDQYALCRRLGGPMSQSGRMRKSSPLPGFNPWTIHPVASRYTIPAHSLQAYIYIYVIHNYVLIQYTAWRWMYAGRNFIIDLQLQLCLMVVPCDLISNTKGCSTSTVWKEHVCQQLHLLGGYQHYVLFNEEQKWCIVINTNMAATQTLG
jgi:hypothetical protein